MTKNFERLPTNVTPEHYELSLNVNFEECKFDGTVTILVNVNQSTNHIKLNASELIIKKAEIHIDDKQVRTREIVLSADDETVSILFDSPLRTGPGQLRIDFSGNLHDKMKGFYLTKQTNGANGACTHFEPTGARMSFPCWDEPALKATFSISLTVPESKNALSNMSIRDEMVYTNGSKRFRFRTTPKMSTYLVAFVIGDFDFVQTSVPASQKNHEEIELRVFTPVGKKEQGRYALTVARDCLTLYNRYFHIQYPLRKCDLIAISDFPISGMENWGLVTFREARILCDPENTSSINKQHIALVIGHELAHMWFGNLVTMHWWTDLWLKEGFAEFIMYLSIGKLYPELETWSSFVAHILGPAMKLDALDNSHSIEIEVGHPSEVVEIFDTITYFKGASIIRMLHSFIGAEKFQLGCKFYLSTYQFGNAMTINLWESFEKVSDREVGKIMSTWTKQKGFPVVEVAQRREPENERVILDFKQKKFSLNAAIDNSKDLWAIPITLCTSRDPETERSMILLDKECNQVVLENIKSNEWIKVNVKSVGFYHVLYEKSHLEELLPGVETKLMSPLDRWGLQNDYFALVKAGQASTVDALKLMKSFRNEDNYTVWSAIDDAIGKLNILLSNTNDEALLYAYGRELYHNIYADLGWNGSPIESHTTVLLRSLIIDRLGAFGDQNVIIEAEKRFEDHMKGSKILVPDLRSAVYRTVLKSNSEHLQSFLKLFGATDMHEEKNRIAMALGSIHDEKLIEQIIEFAMSTNVRSQDTPFVLRALSNSNNGRNMVWSYFKSNCDEFKRRYEGHITFGGLVKCITQNFATESMADEIKEFFNKNPVPGTERSVSQAIETIRMQANWLDRDLELIRKFLSSKSV